MDEARFWNAVAARYALKPVENPAAFERKIAITAALLTPASVVVDIGCGTGSLALRLAPQARHVHGFDIAAQMIGIAGGKAEAQGVRNVSFHEGTLDDCARRFAPASIDVVCAYSLLHLLRDRRAALAGIHRLLKPGGALVASTACLAESWKPYRPLLRAMHALGRAPYVDVFAKRTLAAEVGAAGFVQIAEPDVGAKPTVSFLVARKPGGG